MTCKCVNFRREVNTVAFGGWSQKKLITERKTRTDEVANHLQTARSSEVANLSHDGDHVKVAKGMPVTLERRQSDNRKGYMCKFAML